MTGIVEMIVNMDCPGCEKKVRRALKNLDGVDSVDIDMDLQKVTVTGWADQDEVLKKVRKTGKKAELWPFPHNPQYYAFTHEYSNFYASYSDPASYFQSEQPAVYTYNYYVHGYNGHEHGTYQELPYSTIVGERVSATFSDENVNACSIM